MWLYFLIPVCLLLLLTMLNKSSSESENVENKVNRNQYVSPRPKRNRIRPRK
jgi:hypothetical protein